MLRNLRIRDFAIIDAVDLELPQGFTVVTGETGAGKSILVDALIVGLGGRATADIVRTGAQTAEVEALFDIRLHPLVQARLEARHLTGDDPTSLLIRRVIGRRGRAKVLINGQLSTVATLAELVRGLVDISGQHEQQSLLVEDNHLDILDAFGDHADALSAYAAAYTQLQTLEHERKSLSAATAESVRRADFLRFQLDEIAQLSPEADEFDSLNAERARLTHAEKLQRGSALIEALLYSEDGSAFDKLGRAQAEIETLARIDTALGSDAEQLAEARRQLDDVARSLRRYADRIEVDPARLDAVEGRHEALTRLARKHGGSLELVLKRQEELGQELASLDTAESRMDELDLAIDHKRKDAMRLAHALSALRKITAQRFDAAIEREVADMDLKGAVFRAEVHTRGEASNANASLSARGLDSVEFLWSANPGEPARSLARIASGGELSRLMLAVKRVLCHHDLVSVYVFDEVDTGLGGKAADSIGKKIQAVARGHQALTITHLAPIAARADTHLRVHKRTKTGRTTSVVEAVSGTARDEEIARMIDGAKITRATRQAAQAMLARCKTPTARTRSANPRH